MNGDVACRKTDDAGSVAGARRRARRARAAAPTRSSRGVARELGGPVGRPRRPPRGRPRRSRRRRSRRRRGRCGSARERRVDRPGDERHAADPARGSCPARPCEPPRAGMIAVARAPGAAASGAPIAPAPHARREGASRRSAWVVMPRSYAARADGRCTPGERRATVRSTVDAGGAGCPRWCRRRPWRRPSTTKRMPQAHGPRHPLVSVATGAGAELGRLHHVREQHRAGHRPDAAGVRREVARRPRRRRGRRRRAAAPLPVSLVLHAGDADVEHGGARLDPVGLHEVRHADRRDDDVGAAHLGREVDACASA